MIDVRPEPQFGYRSGAESVAGICADIFQCSSYKSSHPEQLQLLRGAVGVQTSASSLEMPCTQLQPSISIRMLCQPHIELC